MEKWLRNEPSWEKVITSFVWQCAAVNWCLLLALCLLFIPLFSLFGIEMHDDNHGVVISMTTWYFFPQLFGLALQEELVFRFPMLLPLMLFGFNKKTACLTILPFSFLFGIAHGHLYNLAFQGVSGILFSLVFLKCGGVRCVEILKKTDYTTFLAVLDSGTKAIIASTTTHFISNGIIALILLSSGQKTL